MAKIKDYLFILGNYAVLIVLFSIFSCATSSPLNPLKTLAPPLGLEAQANSEGSGILLTYYSANDEEDFDGINVYISEQGNVADTADGKNPFLPEGIAPTILLSPSELDTNLQREYIVLYRDNNLTPLVSGGKYFFIMKAHSSQGYVSPPSNEASAIAP